LTIEPLSTFEVVKLPIVGATFDTTTDCDPSVDTAPWKSAISTFTILATAGTFPSAKRHVKLPLFAALLSAVLMSELPPPPQIGYPVAKLQVSAGSGSEIVNEYVLLSPSLAATGFVLPSVTVGGVLVTVCAMLSELVLKLLLPL
jgi:hypothetical protein